MLQDEERVFNFKLHPNNLPALKCAVAQRVPRAAAQGSYCAWYCSTPLAICLPAPTPLLHTSATPHCRAARIEFVSLANNHCLDYKQAGLAETQRCLAAAGISFAGVGPAAVAARPAVLERAGLRLAFFSYSGTWCCAAEVFGRQHGRRA